MPWKDRWRAPWSAALAAAASADTRASASAAPGASGVASNSDRGLTGRRHTAAVARRWRKVAASDEVFAGDASGAHTGGAGGSTAA